MCTQYNKCIFNFHYLGKMLKVASILLFLPLLFNKTCRLASLDSDSISLFSFAIKHLYCRGGDEFLCLWLFISPGSGLCQNMTKLKHGSHFLSRCTQQLHTHCRDSGQYKIFEDSGQRIFQHIYCVPPAIVPRLYCLNANAL